MSCHALKPLNKHNSSIKWFLIKKSVVESFKASEKTLVCARVRGRIYSHVWFGLLLVPYLIQNIYSSYLVIILLASLLYFSVYSHVWLLESTPPSIFPNESNGKPNLASR